MADLCALAIGGSDSSGAAGLVEDLHAFRCGRVRGAIAVTAVTAQGAEGVVAVHPVPPEVVRAQIDACLKSLPVRAAKTGMLLDRGIVAEVADAFVRGESVPLVVDPVLESTSGHALLDTGGLAELRTRLLPVATIVTPNVPEATALTGLPIGDEAGMERAGRAMLDLGCRAVLVKGGHLPSGPCVDLLIRPEAETVRFSSPRRPGPKATEHRSRLHKGRPARWS
ncbi:MAG: hypothetical protein CME07_01000, partial [Gemmatimonadetes bacterium]|nr:hypothetical protein [Gemmatimonadota bacterium]